MEKKKRIIYKRFPGIHFKKIILYKNPNECSDIKLERVNPTHIGILWGRRKKSLHKGSNYIRIGKVYFSIVPIAYGLSVAGWMDGITYYVYGILAQMTIFGLFTAIISSILLYAPVILRSSEKRCQVS